MTLIEQEMEKRNKTLIAKAKENFGKKIESFKAQRKENQEFEKQIKAQEKISYKKGMLKEAGKYGRSKARNKYAKRKRLKMWSGGSGKISLGNTGTPGFMELPGKKKGKKEKTAFDW